MRRLLPSGTTAWVWMTFWDTSGTPATARSAPPRLPSSMWIASWMRFSSPSWMTCGRIADHPAIRNRSQVDRLCVVSAQAHVERAIVLKRCLVVVERRDRGPGEDPALARVAQCPHAKRNPADVPQVRGEGDGAAAVCPRRSTAGSRTRARSEAPPLRTRPISSTDTVISIWSTGLSSSPQQTLVGRNAVPGVAHDHRVQSRVADHERFLPGAPGANDTRQPGRGRALGAIVRQDTGALELGHAGSDPPVHSRDPGHVGDVHSASRPAPQGSGSAPCPRKRCWPFRRRSRTGPRICGSRSPAPRWVTAHRPASVRWAPPASGQRAPPRPPFPIPRIAEDRISADCPRPEQRAGSAERRGCRRRSGRP